MEMVYLDCTAHPVDAVMAVGKPMHTRWGVLRDEGPRDRLMIPATTGRSDNKRDDGMCERRLIIHAVLAR